MPENKIKILLASLKKDLLSAEATADTEKIWRQYLGDKGSIKLALKDIKNMAAAEKKIKAPLMQRLYLEALDLFKVKTPIVIVPGIMGSSLKDTVGLRDLIPQDILEGPYNQSEWVSALMDRGETMDALKDYVLMGLPWRTEAWTNIPRLSAHEMFNIGCDSEGPMVDYLSFGYFLYSALFVYPACLKDPQTIRFLLQLSLPLVVLN